LHAEHGTIAVVEGPTFQEPSTSRAADALDRWDATRPVLVLLAKEDEACAKSFRNIDRVKVMTAPEAGVADVLGAASVVVSAAALDLLARLGAERQGEEDDR
jgi:large subunit ribosomal protein L4